jgi:deazaflavin-dependent oxidoreductase (nitroreductase family)
MELRRVDPTRPHSAVTRALHRFGGTSAGRWYGIKLAAPLDAFLLRHTGGRMRLAGPLPTALLTTTGARSGATRESPVVYFHQGDDVILTASSFGRDKHPGWLHNLRANPEVRLNGQPFRADEVTEPAEAERLFALAVRVYPGYAGYRTRAAAVGRTIPMVRLTPIAH